MAGVSGSCGRCKLLSTGTRLSRLMSYVVADVYDGVCGPLAAHRGMHHGLRGITLIGYQSLTTARPVVQRPAMSFRVAFCASFSNYEKIYRNVVYPVPAAGSERPRN